MEVCNFSSVLSRTEHYSGDFSSPKGNLGAIRKKEMKAGDVFMGIDIYVYIVENVM